MAPQLLFALLVISYSLAAGQLTTSTSTPSATSTTPVTQWFNPTSGGKVGSPGAIIHITNKTLDAIHRNMSETLAQNIQSMAWGDLTLPIGLGLLTVKAPRITESKLPNYEYSLVTPNRIRSRLHGGRFVAEGGWQYKPAGSRSYQAAFSGKYRALVVDGEVNTTNQLSRTNDAKPMVQTIECKTNFSRFRVELTGAPNLTTIEHCDNPVCDKIRSFFEAAVCQLLRTFITGTINAQLATYPSRIDITGEDVKLNYDLLNNQPTIIDGHIQTGIEARILWRNPGSVPFYPPVSTWVDKNRMLSFALTDYTFNTLFHQAHAQGYRYSAYSLLSTPSIQDQLLLNCTGDRNEIRGGVKKLRSDKVTRSCLGTLLETSSQFSSNDTGDIQYKSDKAPTVLILSNTAYFDAGNGYLEIHGRVGQDKYRYREQVLARAYVQVFRGEFVPKLNGINITGTIKNVQLQLARSPGIRQMDEWMAKFSQFAQPILLDMFNAFLNMHAQFPVPLLANYQCTSPDLTIQSRTVQVDCDVQSKNKRWAT